MSGDHGGVRTPDLNIRSVLLFQLSYVAEDLVSSEKSGGLIGNRTRVRGFAGRCVTTPPSGQTLYRPDFHRAVVGGEDEVLDHTPTGNCWCPQ